MKRRKKKRRKKNKKTPKIPGSPNGTASASPLTLVAQLLKEFTYLLAQNKQKTNKKLSFTSANSIRILDWFANERWRCFVISQEDVPLVLDI